MLRQSLIVGLILIINGSGPAYSSPGPRCTIYEHRDMQGAWLKMPSGDAITMAARPIGDTYWREKPNWNDVVSSIHLDAGCRIQVWEDIDGRGASRTWRAKSDRGYSLWYVGSDWNDRISSAVCTCS
jgi:hypothetical protein